MNHLNRIKSIHNEIRNAKAEGRNPKAYLNKINDIQKQHLHLEDHELAHALRDAYHEMDIHHSGDCAHPPL